MNHVSTGSPVLDQILGGGLPRGSLISVTGLPGTGKTIFAANWIHDGMKNHGERAVYVSFVEGYETFIQNMSNLGFEFEKLEREGKFRFVEMITLKGEGVPTLIEQIIKEISEIKASRLVIDSFSAICQMIENRTDLRIITHMILSKIVRQLGCTTMILIEKPGLNENHEPVEFISDCIISLSKTEVNGATLRQLNIIKARGREIKIPVVAFTLKGGFRAFKPLSLGMLEEPYKKFKIIPHGEGYLSSGISDLENMMGPIFREGSFNLLEVEKDISFPPERLLRVTVQNALNQGEGVAILPPQGVSALSVKKSLEPFVEKRILERNLKVADYRVTPAEKAEPYVVLLDGRFIIDDMEEFWSAIHELTKNTSKPALSIVGFDTLEYMYGKDEVLKVLGADLARVRNLNYVRLNISRPNIALTDHLRALADKHLVLREICGALFIQGIKPKTPMLNVSVSTEGDLADVKLTPIL
ncbi:MAG: ATPase domain-containing protein [Nitrososphaerota archaeon]|nr:AAA family ATPase [Candidatus Bathyarchaeota archaeon]MDW8193903.1 ATPase domain-containing protein [Nitrososphaerota archaeon]